MMDKYRLSHFAVIAVLALIFFLSYTSQILFYFFEPGPLDGNDTAVFNLLLACMLVCYARACLTEPGRIPKDWKGNDLKSKDLDKGKVLDSDDDNDRVENDTASAHSHSRWCRKCEAPKPPRAHHCKICKRCIPKMDHHCPWTINCVSHRTFPHFMRFLFYACASMIYLQYFLWQRVTYLWENRDMPSYLGPTIFQLLYLIALIFTNSITLFALFVLFVRSIWSLAVNTFTIEGWEIERHHALLRRARVLGGYLDAPGGVRVKIVRQEFPYDIGVWSNLVQGMGTSNLLAWFWPLARSFPLDGGLNWPTNGFEDPSIGWPPPDPDRIPRPSRTFNPLEAFIDPNEAHADPADRVAAFQYRQKNDMLRRQNQITSSSSIVAMSTEGIRKRRKFGERFNGDGEVTYDSEEDEDIAGDDRSDRRPKRGVVQEGEEAWASTEGERLADFGVDEDVEFYDEEQVPLAELLRRRKVVSGHATA